MSTTANQVYLKALALIDEVDSTGAATDAATDSYAGKAPSLIDTLQLELMLYEDVTLATAITTLSGTLGISDDTALRVMPYGLAAKFALADKDAEFYNEYSNEYEKLKRTIQRAEADITDEYDILGGLQTYTDNDF